MKQAEIFSIGNELLRGIVADTNAHWIAQRLTARGARVTRAIMLPDDPPVVAAALRESFARSPALIVTHGGLGPTADDLTRDAVSLAVGLPLEPDPLATEIVTRRYAELFAAGAVGDATLSPERARMAALPRGARALDNTVGAAPGVVVSRGHTTVVCLPGVPPEMKWIFEHPLAPFLDQIIGPGGYAEWTAVASTLDESAIAHVLEDIQARHPDVYVKSRAKTFEDADAVRVTLSASGTDDAEAQSLLDAARTDAIEALRALGVELS